MKGKKCPGCGRKKPKGSFRLLRTRTNAETKHFAKGRLCAECQEQQPNRTESLKPYATRNLLLRRMGYSSYQEYLASDRWQRIRERVLRLRGRVCQRCGNPGSVVHHQLYHIKVLQGSSLRGLRVLCRECHEFVEFEEGRKTGLVEASHRYHA